MGDKLAFSVRVRREIYGDDRVFYKYQVVMWDEMRLAVGTEQGPARASETPLQARAVARMRIDELRKRELYAIRVTKKEISEGEAHSCNSCAIALALWQAQKSRMNIDPEDFNFRIIPYGFMTDVDGIVLEDIRNRREATMPEMPELLIAGAPDSPEGMCEWASNWDDWMRKQAMTAKEWRAETGEELPHTPSPCSFVLDLTHFREQLKGGIE